MQIVWVAALGLTIGCNAPTDGVALPDAAPAMVPDAAPAMVPDATPFVDQDGDGLDDLRELQLAADYEPFISLDPGDGCPLDGLLVRVRPHPADPSKVLIVYDQLFQHDCGLNVPLWSCEGNVLCPLSLSTVRPGSTPRVRRFFARRLPGLPMDIHRLAPRWPVSSASPTR